MSRKIREFVINVVEPVRFEEAYFARLEVVQQSLGSPVIVLKIRLLGSQQNDKKNFIEMVVQWSSKRSVHGYCDLYK